MDSAPPAAMSAEDDAAPARVLPAFAIGRSASALALILLASHALAQDFPPEIQPPPPSPPPVVKPRPAPRPPVEAVPEPTPEPLAIPPWPVDSVGPPMLVPAGDPGDEAFVGPPMVPPFRIFETEVLPGASARLEWNASQSFAGGEVISPVTVVHGTRPGPVLCLTAAVHGDELNGVEIVRRVVNELKPGELGGTVIGVPIVNLFGFTRNSRYLPDRRDLNRFFPGSRYGSIASRIAFSFFANVVKHCDAVVDFHTGSFDRSNLPQVRADLSNPDVLEFTRGFGATTVLHSEGSKGMLRVAATLAGIPAVAFEVGGPGQLQPAEIGHGVQAMHTLLHKLGMTRTRPEWDEPQPVFYDSVWVRSNAGGLLLSEVQLGQRVQRGQKLGSVIDPINNIEREIVAPVYGRVIGMALNQVVLPGFAAYHLGEETSEQQAVREAAAGGAASPVEEDPDSARDREADPEAMPPEDEDDFEED
jgi:predicted deacylase